jgi:hypothetical protein
VIALAVSAASDDDGMTLGELRAALDRVIDSGAPEDGPVRVVVSRLHRVRRVEVEFDNPDAPDPAPVADAAGS